MIKGFPTVFYILDASDKLYGIEETFAVLVESHYSLIFFEPTSNMLPEIEIATMNAIKGKYNI